MIKSTTALSFLSVALLAAGAAHAKEVELPAKMIAQLRTQPGVNEMACDRFIFYEYTPAAVNYEGERLAPVQDIMRGKKILSDAKITCELNKEARKNGQYTLNAFETGTLNGKPISFYHTDGSASFGGNIFTNPGAWSVSCKIDAMTDEKYCVARNSGLLLWRDKFGWSVSVLGEHSPHTKSLIRINGGKPFSTTHKDGTFSNADSQQIVNQLKSGAKVINLRVRPRPIGRGYKRGNCVTFFDLRQYGLHFSAYFVRP